MKTKFLSAIVVATIGMHLMSCAQAKKATGASAYASLMESNMHRTLPGVRGAEPITEYNFIITWNSSTPPQSFFWRGEDGWLGCSVALAHKAKGTSEYTFTDVRIDKIKKGDILKLTPMPGGKYPIPASIPKNATNTIYFKTINNKWLGLPVKKFNRQADTIMP